MNARISTRMIVGFSTIIVLTIIIAVTSVVIMNGIGASLTTVNDVNAVKQRFAINFRGSVHDRAISLRDVVLLQDDGDRRAALAEIETLARFYADSAGPLDALMAAEADTTDRERDILASIKAIEVETLPMIERVIAAQAAGDAEGALTILLAEARPAFTEWLRRINQFIDFQEDANQRITAETRTLVARAETGVLVLALVFAAIGIGFARWSTLGLRPLAGLSRAMLDLADGKLEVAIADAPGRTEVAEMTRAVKVFKDNAVRVRDLQRQEAEASERNQAERKAELNGLADRFEGSVLTVVRRVADASGNLDETAGGLNALAERTTGTTGEARSASVDTKDTVQAVAASTEQLSASIEEIGQQASHSLRIAQQASEEAEATTLRVQELVDAANRIGDVVQLITDIAEQTNLLALNATIEAARAGEAGKGFAIVASEVKNLAGQTAKATDEIARQVQAVQAVSGSMQGAIKGIGGVIDEVNAITTRISASVDQQTAATQEIAERLRGAATAAALVTESVMAVSDLADEAGSTAQKMVYITTGVRHETSVLGDEVERFVGLIRQGRSIA